MLDLQRIRLQCPNTESVRSSDISDEIAAVTNAEALFAMFVVEHNIPIAAAESVIQFQSWFDTRCILGLSGLPTCPDKSGLPRFFGQFLNVPRYPDFSSVRPRFFSSCLATVK